MRTLRSLMLLLAGLATGLPRAAGATTSDGTLITNLASATFRDNGGIQREISYGATSWVLVATPVIMMGKNASPTLASSGGTVTFCITFSNASGLTSAVNLVIADHVPDYVRFQNDVAINDPAGGSVTPAWSTDNVNWSLAWPPGMGQGPTSAGPGTGVFLRWTVDVVGPKRTGFVCYSVTIL